MGDDLRTERELSLDFLRVTEAAAIAAASRLPLPPMLRLLVVAIRSPAAWPGLQRWFPGSRRRFAGAQA